VIVRRFSLILFILFAIVTMTYGMVRASGGSALSQEKSVGNAELEAEQKRQYEEEHNYFKYLKDLAHGELGRNNKGRPIKEIIAPAIPVSFSLGFLSTIFALFIGVSAGIIGAFYQNRWPDRLSMLIALIGLSIPSFVLGPLLQMTFAVELDLLPVSRWWQPFDPYTTGSFLNVILPTITLACWPAATIARLTRSSMLEAINQDYMRTALAKGLSERAAVIRHGMKNACLPVLSYLGPATAFILTGSLVVERIFGITTGLGTHFISAAEDRDIELLLSIVLLSSFLLLIFNLIIDFSYSLIDPRIKDS
jgi:oligopeptide transport system permease protein